MEIKITADRKLLDALERIAAAITPAAAPVAATEAPRTAKAAQAKTAPTPAPGPATAPAEAATTAQETPPAETAAPVAAPVAVPSREEVQKLAIARVHEGKREEMRALLTRYHAGRVSEVAEDKLAAFKAELEVL